MRLWTLHPRYLDTKGLLAVWREGLLAQKVLQSQTIGYRNHPQLRRFLDSPDPVGAIAAYLRGICQEAARRGYKFQEDKIVPLEFRSTIPCTRGQLLYEWNHLLAKLRRRDLNRYPELENVVEPEHHPLFHMVECDVDDWEVRSVRLLLSTMMFTEDVVMSSKRELNNSRGLRYECSGSVW